MGNCQAIDNSTLAIQHPCGRVDKLYWPVAASEVMKMNPGHYVALLLTTTTTTNNNNVANQNHHRHHHHHRNSVRITRIKLLRPTDSLILGQVYRLITTQEVMKGLWAKKYGKMKKKQSDSAETETESRRFEFEEKISQVLKHERNQPRTTSASTNSVAAAAKSRGWQPSLQSISEATS